MGLRHDADADVVTHHPLMRRWHHVRVPTRARILVVDDDPRLAASLRRALAF